MLNLSSDQYMSIKLYLNPVLMDCLLLHEFDLPNNKSKRRL